MKDVARELKCSKSHVCNLAAGRVRGCSRLPALRMGRRVLVRREALAQWVDASSTMDQSPERVTKSA